MNLKEDIRPITTLKTRAAELLEQVNQTQRPIVITQNGVARGVLQDPESYERMRQAIGLLKLLAQGEDDVRAGRTLAGPRFFADLRKQLESRKRRHGQSENV
jgi:prevent-host-death family protein